jgi:cellulose synthase/poly-beta-1,6-N-acetylglucosamine synthase-like glycosyltransferase
MSSSAPARPRTARGPRQRSSNGKVPARIASDALTGDHDPADERLWVVVPAYNEAAGIGATLDALSGQTDLDFTLVVVDNASTDDTAVVVREFAARAPGTAGTHRPARAR